MILTIDVGNTNIVLGAYKDKELIFSSRIATDTRLEADQYALQIRGVLQLHGLNSSELKGAVMSSVVPQITDTLINSIKSITPVVPTLLTHEIKTGIDIKIDRPAELGTDLLAGVIGAKANYALPAIVIDMGTATKITAVDDEGNIIGCSIMPGVFISINALTKNASALGGIAIKAPKNGNAIGTNTICSMQSGVVYGSAAMLDGMIDRFCAEMGEVRSILATGGAAHCIVPHCKHSVTLAPTLILEGLRSVYDAVSHEE